MSRLEGAPDILEAKILDVNPELQNPEHQNSEPLNPEHPNGYHQSANITHRDFLPSTFNVNGLAYPDDVR